MRLNVVKANGLWTVRKAGAGRALKRHQGKWHAVEHAVKLAMQETQDHVTVFVFGDDDRIEGKMEFEETR